MALTLDEALAQASEENGLEPWYRDCVRPLLRSGPEGYPTCCGGSCEPCAMTLVRVADRARELMEVGRDAGEGDAGSRRGTT